MYSATVLREYETGPELLITYQACCDNCNFLKTVNCVEGFNNYYCTNSLVKDHRELFSTNDKPIGSLLNGSPIPTPEWCPLDGKLKEFFNGL